MDVFGVEVTREDIQSFTRFFLAVGLIVWAYNLGYHDAMKTVEYVNSVCGPGSAELDGMVAKVYASPYGIVHPGDRIYNGPVGPMYVLDDNTPSMNIYGQDHNTN